MEIRDVHFNRGPFGKLHVRLGKGARGSRPRPRWVPMLDQLDELLRWYLAEARPRFREKGPVLFCDESGGVMAFGTIRNRLAYLQQLEHAPVEERFSPHALRRACATRNYERGVDLVAIQQMLGHWHVGTTMRYVQPSSTFVEGTSKPARRPTAAAPSASPRGLSWTIAPALPACRFTSSALGACSLPWEIRPLTFPVRTLRVSVTLSPILDLTSAL